MVLRFLYPGSNSGEQTDWQRRHPDQASADFERAWEVFRLGAPKSTIRRGTTSAIGPQKISPLWSRRADAAGLAAGARLRQTGSRPEGNSTALILPLPISTCPDLLRVQQVAQFSPCLQNGRADWRSQLRFNIGPEITDAVVREVTIYNIAFRGRAVVISHPVNRAS